ncbi:MAG: DUF4399 domain-containing protein [Alphaproteobacteria bacterium]|nr:DUF4399 domain-containing protein [Alphaproteobacteria bacterium]
MKFLFVAVAAALLITGCSEASQEQSTNTQARVYFVEPNDGANVKKSVKVVFGVEGMEIVPAGTDKPNSGHHHLLIDSSLEDYSSPIPSDENHIHFGKGQTETVVELSPGKHTLQLILGDMNHVPHKPAVESDVITITVEE